MALLSKRRVDSLGPTQARSLQGIVLGCLRVVRRSKVPLPGVLVATIANAVGESDLDPTAIGDSGRSIGLYQFHFSASGRSLGSELARKGYSLDDLTDPVLSTELILAEAARAAPGWVDNARYGSIAGLVELFTRFAERPKAPDQKVAERVRIAASWLEDPAWVYLPIPELVRVSGVSA